MTTEKIFETGGFEQYHDEAGSLEGCRLVMGETVALLEANAEVAEGSQLLDSVALLKRWIDASTDYPVLGNPRAAYYAFETMRITNQDILSASERLSEELEFLRAYLQAYAGIEEGEEESVRLSVEADLRGRNYYN